VVPFFKPIHDPTYAGDYDRRSTIKIFENNFNPAYNIFA